MIAKVKALLLNHWKECLLLLCFIVIGFMAFYIHHLTQIKHEQQETPVTMTATSATDENQLMKTLDTNRANTTAARRQIIDAQYALKAPVVTYSVQNDTGYSDTKAIAEKLATGDSSTPKEALEKSDKTIVAEQPNNPTIPVGVYKINLYKNWETGIGYGRQDGESYIPISIQRNYSRNHSIMLEGHYDLTKQQMNGYEIQWKTNF